ncbi:hypothetical protein KSP40_PGU016648 [Platanthera guangdongensis]|uniref:Uncharacterized protein n=1 Tax=Platanthera guangdongensis TaxID=2320717 RepID=A0ABR2N4J6_9ASPA
MVVGARRVDRGRLRGAAFEPPPSPLEPAKGTVATTVASAAIEVGKKGLGRCPPKAARWEKFDRSAGSEVVLLIAVFPGGRKVVERNGS